MKTRRRAIVALSFCLAATVVLSAAPPQVDPALARLAKVQIFAFGGIGFTGATSEGEKDFAAIAARPSAEAEFEKLLTIGTPEAKCYALTGILKLNPARFAALSLSPVVEHSSATQVTTMQGCLMFHHALRDVVESIRAGIYSR
jgi:hypothetical protein